MKKFLQILSLITKNFFLIVPLSFFSQNTSSIKKIDSIYAKTNEEIKKYTISFNHVIKINYDLAKEAKKINYTHGEVRSLIALGRHLNNIDKNTESLKYLNLAEELNKEVNNSSFNAQIYTEYAKNFSKLGDYTKSLNYYNRALKIFKSDNNLIKDKEYLSYIYGCKATTFQNLNQKDSLYANILIANKINENPVESARIARYHLLYNKNQDSCKFYLKKADSLLATNKFIKVGKAIVLRIYGLSSFKAKDYNNATKYYKESIDVSKKFNKLSECGDTIMMLYEVYVVTKNKEEQLKLLKEYTELNTKITTQKNNALLYVMNKSLDEEKETSNKLLYFLITSITLGLLSSYVFYVFYKKRISQKKNLLLKKEEETKELKLKVNETFEEIITLAKENHPNFYTRFQEIYPDFQRKILAINPNLQNSELVLLAYIYLDFETKEIADYIYKSPKTIQNRKHNLRKKLQISSSEDIYVWLKSL